jgi:deazaflavin-dependent oxidoreductase (nitroreductase family)
LARQYRVGAFVRFNNAFMRSLLRTGIRFGTFAILAVQGRKSGRRIQTPLVMFRYGDNDYLVASYGIVNWVRNIRAAGGRAELIRRRRTETIRAVELPPEQAAPILRHSLQNGPPGIPRLIVRVYRRLLVLPYLDVDLNSSPTEFEHSASAHPVFLITAGSDR